MRPTSMTITKRKGVWWYGDMPVPATAMWSGEEGQGELRPCQYVSGGVPALWAPERPGQGRPRFKNPHPVRQRRAMALMLCDICGRPLRTKTKYLLGNLRQVPIGAAREMVWTTQEPLVCAACVPLATEHCPFVRSWPEALEGWEPLVVQRWRLVATVVDQEALALISGGGVFDRPGVAYLKLMPGMSATHSRPIIPTS